MRAQKANINWNPSDCKMPVSLGTGMPCKATSELPTDKIAVSTTSGTKDLERNILAPV
jgi:hypothetical protein